MKRLFSIIQVLLFAGMMGGAFTSCEDIMSTDSNRLTLADNNLIDSPNDSVYSILGILSQVQNISDKYVLLGELRGDLMDVTPTSESDLRDLSQFNIDASTNQFADPRDFYSVINNCNFFIQRVDTNIAVKAYKPFVKELAVAKTIRAWTYMQLALNFGKVSYFTKPILTVKDSEENFPELTPEQLIDSLITDLNTMNPMAPASLPGYGTINGVPSRLLFIDTKFLMGDLYLWKASYTKNTADYEMAATYYSELMKEGSYTNRSHVGVRWINDFFLSYSDAWSNWLTSTTGVGELISIAKLANNNYEGTTSQVALLCEDNKLASSKPMDDLFEAQTYCYYDPVSSSAKLYPGDLRGKAALRTRRDDDKTIITKFEYYNITFYRTGLLYLRYAEAVNRAGKPSLSFAVLKYGLNSATLRDAKRVVPSDISDNKEYVTKLTNASFDGNVGMHNRGSGNSTYNLSYAIPDYTRYTPVVVRDNDGNPLVGADGNDSIISLPTTLPDLLAEAKMDSILFVESAICDELALETGFEGNRFQDLMRFSNHRNDTEFLARKVAAKHNNDNTLFIKLKDRNNWFLPVKP